MKREKLNQKDVSVFIGLMKNYGYKPEFTLLPKNRFMYYSNSIIDTPRIANARKVLDLLDISNSPVFMCYSYEYI